MNRKEPMMYELSPKAQKARRESYVRQMDYWPTLYRTGNEMILVRPMKFRILTESREEFFEKLAKHRAYFTDLVAKELPMFRFDSTRKIQDRKKPGAWVASLTVGNYEAVEEMCRHYNEILLNKSRGIEEWLDGVQVT